MHPFAPPEDDRPARARDLVAAVLPDDVAAELDDAAPDDDLRDLGLDSIRLIGLVDTLRARGAVVEAVDLLAEPTLARIAQALPRDTARPEETP